jgi:hypothetical protein
MRTGFVGRRNNDGDNFCSTPGRAAAPCPNLSLNFIEALYVRNGCNGLKCGIPNVGVASVIDDKGCALFGFDGLRALAAVAKGT